MNRRTFSDNGGAFWTPNTLTRNDWVSPKVSARETIIPHRILSRKYRMLSGVRHACQTNLPPLPGIRVPMKITTFHANRNLTITCPLTKSHFKRSVSFVGHVCFFSPSQVKPPYSILRLPASLDRPVVMNDHAISPRNMPFNFNAQWVPAFPVDPQSPVQVFARLPPWRMHKGINVDTGKHQSSTQGGA